MPAEFEDWRRSGKRRWHTLAVLYGCLAFCAATNPSRAADWPQWRGPHRDGVSEETGLLQEWPKDGPPTVWKVTDLGSGFSTPSVVGDRLYLLSNEGLENESVKALRASDGKVVWSSRVGKVGNPNQQPNYPAARSTPTVVGELLYVLGSDGDLACLETASGKTRWTKNLRSEFHGQPGVWAYAESPLVDGEKVVCTPGGSNATVVALNRMSGDVVWKCEVPEGDQAAYASAVIDQIGGVKQYVQFLQKSLVGIEADTGKLLWSYRRTAQGSPANIPTPVADGEYIFSGASLSGGGLIKVSRNGDGFAVEQIAFSPKLPTAIGGAVKVGDYLYGTTGQALLCVEFKTGKLQWDERALAPASLCYADHCLYLHGENGEVALVQAASDGYHEKGHFAPAGQPSRGNAKAWAYPVVANGRLYIRDVGNLWAYDIRAH